MTTTSVTVETPLKVFISYAGHDLELARRLAGCLAAQGFSPWLDQNEVTPGENWALRSGEALRDADAMVVLVSPEAADNQQMKFDMDYALTERRFAGRLLPVLIGDASEDALPWILKRFPIVRVAYDNWDGACDQILATLRAAAASTPG